MDQRHARGCLGGDVGDAMLKVEEGHHLGLGGLEKGDDAEEEGAIVKSFLDNIGGLELSGHPLLRRL